MHQHQKKQVVDRRSFQNSFSWPSVGEEYTSHMDPDYEEHKDNSKFKAYVSDFGSSLTQFEKAKEWADLIKCLQRVTSILKKYSQFPSVVPDKLVFCKRLSQCCNPALPSGVHLKTLETYEIVFERIGSSKLAKDLPYYSVGLFPLFANASMQIRPKIIDLFKTYYLPIGRDLLPCLNGLVMALVPGLEEQNNEFYRSIVKLLDDVGDNVGQRNLFHTMWKIVSLNSSIRIGAINYLMEKIPKKKSDKDLNVYMPNASTLVLTAMIRAIDDPVVLVQRSVLDLLLTHFKLSESIFDEQSLSHLIRRTLMLQLRREISLNRRVYTWLLGEDTNQSQEYFLKYSKRALVLALYDLFDTSDSTNQGQTPLTLEKAILPFKILLALFDKPEVSAPIINEIIEDIIESLHKYCNGGHAFTAEIVAQVNTVLDGLRPAVVWQFLNQFVRTDVAQFTSPLDSPQLGLGTARTFIAPPGSPSTCRSLLLAGTLLDKMIGLNSFESITSFLPEFINSLVAAAAIASQSPRHLNVALHCVQLILKVIGKMQQPVARGSGPPVRTASPAPNTSSTSSSQGVPTTSLGFTGSDSATPTLSLNSSSGQNSPILLPNEVLLNAVANFENFYRDLTTKVLMPIWKEEVVQANSIRDSQALQALNIGQKKVVFGPGASDIASTKPVSRESGWSKTTSTILLDYASQVLFAFYSTFWSSFGIVAPNPSQAPLHEWFEATVAFCDFEHPIVSCLSIRTIVSFLNLTNTNPSASKLQSYLLHSTRICHSLARRLWDLVKPSTSIVHYRVATTFLELKDVCSDVCEDVICEALLLNSLEARLEAHQRFALLWRLTSEVGAGRRSFDRALFLMLDSLNDEQPIIKLACRTWLADSISKVERILDPLLLVLLDKSTIRTQNGIYQNEYDCRRVLYALKVLQSIIECDFKLWMHNAMNKAASKDMIELYKRQVIADAPAATETQMQGNATSASPPPSVAGSDPSVKPISDAYSFIPVETYLYLLVVESLRFITGTPPRNASAEFATKNSVVQTTAVGFLQFLLTKITASQKASDLALILHEPILQALAQSVSDTHLILQVNLLGLIRSIVLIDNANDSKAKEPATSAASTATPGKRLPRVIDAIGQSQLFLQTVSIGLLQINTDFNIRFYWLDFITSCLPYLNNYAHLIIPPILQCLCDIVSTHKNAYDSIESKDTLMIIRAMKVILHHAISLPTQEVSDMMNITPHPGASGAPAQVPSQTSSSGSSTASTGASGGSTTSQTSSTGFSTFFKTLFVSEGSSGDAQANMPREHVSAIGAVLERLDIIMKGLLTVWGNAGAQFKSSFPEFGPMLTPEVSATAPASDFGLSSLFTSAQGLGSTSQSRGVNFGNKPNPSSSLLSLSPASSSSNLSISTGTGTDSNPRSDEFSSDEIHNRYVVQDHLLALLELFYTASPTRFLECLLKDWVYVSRHPEQLMGTLAPKLPQDARYASPEYITRTQKHKAICIDILNHMSNVSGESLIRALGEVLKNAHLADQQRALRLAQAKRRGVNFIHLQDACIAEFAVLIIDWGNKVAEQVFPAAVSFIRALLASHNPHAVFQAWKLLDCLTNKLSGGANTAYNPAGNPQANSAGVRGYLANPKVKKELHGVVHALCETSLTILHRTYVDLSCSWKMTLRFLDVYDERSDPVIMDEQTQQQIKAFVSLQLTLVLRDHLIAVLEKTSDETRTVSNVLSQLVHHFSNTIQNESVRTPQLAQESAAVIERMAAAPHIVDPKIWKKSALELFLYWPDLLRVSSVTQLKCFQKIVALLFAPKHEEGTGGWSEFTKYVGKAVAPQTIFTGQAEASIQRALSVRRLAFIILSGIQDQYLDQLPWIQEKLVEALRQREGHSDTFAAVFLCLRVLLVKVKSEAMRSFWPAILSEMLGVFSMNVAEKAPHAPILPDPELIFAVTKFLDLVFMLSSEQLNIHEWIFISDPVEETIVKDEKSAFVPFLDRVSRRAPAAASNFNAQLQQQGGLLGSSMARLGKHMAPVVPIQKLDVNPTPLGMTWDAFIAWLARYSDLQYLNRAATQYFADADEAAQFLLSDFALNKGLDPNDWTLLRVSTDFSSSSVPISAPTKEPSIQARRSSASSGKPTAPSPTTIVVASAPSPSPLQTLLDVEENANATLFGDVLD